MDITKIANAILYMIDTNVSHLNDKKISIMLFLMDYESIAKNDKKIFDDTYIKMPRNPEPKLLTELFEIMANDENLEDDDFRLDLLGELLSFIEVQIEEKEKFIELKFLKYEEEFDRSIFKKEEMDIIEDIIKKYKNTTARNIANECFKIEKVRQTQKGEEII